MTDGRQRSALVSREALDRWRQAAVRWQDRAVALGDAAASVRDALDPDDPATRPLRIALTLALREAEHPAAQDTARTQRDPVSPQASQPVVNNTTVILPPECSTIHERYTGTTTPPCEDPACPVHASDGATGSKPYEACRRGIGAGETCVRPVGHEGECR